jgi:hypothetical protein
MAASVPVHVRLMAAALLLATSSASHAEDRLVVRMYLDVKVAPREMAAAEIVAAAILASAHLQTAWRDCATSCPDVLGPSDVVVRIVAAPEKTQAGVLGSSLVDVEAKMGTLATIYADRVETMAARAGVDAGTLLGRAIAHEIGHLLLGTSAHAAAGLMRARWSDRELQRNLASDWRLSARETALVRRGLAARRIPERLAMFRSKTQALSP